MVTTKRAVASILGAMALASVSGTASAQTAIGNPISNANTTCTAITTSQTRGQTFTVPSGVSSIASVSIAASGVGTPGGFRFALRTAAGGLLFGQDGVSSTSLGANATEVLTIPGGYAVSPGQTFFISLVNLSATPLAACVQAADAYAGGVFLREGVLYSVNDTPFRVVFNDSAAAVPTLSEWAMILFGTILAGGAALYIQRRRMIV